MSLTYVTAFLHIYKGEKPVLGRTLTDRLAYALPLLHSKIPLVLFISPCYLEAVQALCPSSSQIQFQICELADTETYRLLEPFQTNIPVHRNHEKDTFEFLALMNAKAEFVSKVAEQNPFGTAHFAWVDFSIFHVLKNPLVSQKRLEQLCSSTLAQSLVIPGCWDTRPGVSKDNVHWRFCGGFYMGTQAAVKQFYEFHKVYLPKAFEGCTWEVNYWAVIERAEPTFPIGWYKADHNDSILEVPESLFLQSPEPPVLWLTKKATRSGRYDYPSLPGYQPTSSSFLEFQGQQFLNVRYVNYTQTPEGMYIINDPRNFLRTENRLCVLENYETVVQSSFLKIVTDLPVTGESIQGLEDVRLYESEGQLKFIATQQQYSATRQSRMTIGTVDVLESLLTDLAVLDPPHPTNCEKNWIPIQKDGQDLFIYQWHPFQIGKVTEGRLEIVQTVETPSSFQKVRGSTTFHEVAEGLIGLVHWSEERHPRHYYHMLVLLDKETLEPIERSGPFVFGRIGIEFCIGMAVRGCEFQFWYSQHDRDPVWLLVPRSELPMRPI